MTDRGHFAQVPMSAIKRLRGTTRLVYEWHCLTMDKRTSVARWSQSRIALELGISLRSVERAEAALRLGGWLRNIGSSRHGGVVVLVPHVEHLRAPDTDGGLPDADGGVGVTPTDADGGRTRHPCRENPTQMAALLEPLLEPLLEQSSHARALSAFEQTRAAIAATPDTAAHYRWLLEAWNKTCAAKWGTPKATEAIHTTHQVKALNAAVEGLTHEAVQAALDTLVAKGHDHVTLAFLAKRTGAGTLRLQDLVAGEDMSYFREKDFVAPKAVSLPCLLQVLKEEVPPSLHGYDKREWGGADMKPHAISRYLELIEQHYPDAYAAWAAEAEIIITAAHERGVPRHDLRFEAREHSAHEAHREPICELFERAVAAVKEVA
jgi:hypothetical protein